MADLPAGIALNQSGIKHNKMKIAFQKLPRAIVLTIAVASWIITPHLARKAIQRHPLPLP
jgi:hypothetical protein